MKRYTFLLSFLLSALIPAAAQAAIAFVADGGYAQGSPATPTAPAGVSLNDTIVICATVRTSTAGGTITTPAGFTVGVTTGSVTDGGGTFNNNYMFYKTAAAGDVTLSSGAGTYSIAYNTGGSSPNVSADVRDYSGAATASQINSTATVLGGNNSFVTIPALSETFVSGEWYVACSSDETAPAGTPTSSPTLSHVYNNAGFLNSLFIGDLIPGSSPAAETITYGGPVTGRPAWGMSLKPAAGGVVPPSRLPLMGIGN